MTTYVAFLGVLVRTCEQLRQAGLPDDKVEDFARRCVERVSAMGPEDVADGLGRLGEVAASGAGLEDVVRAMDRIGSDASRPEASDRPVVESSAPADGPRYPNVAVSLAGLEDQFWPILRKVAYAMGDAGLDETEIERYKTEMKDGQDPVGVSRRWVEIS